MIFHGPATAGLPFGVPLTGAPLAATGWVRQAPPNASQECRDNAGKLECRTIASNTAASSAVRSLQEALKNLSLATGKFGIDPGVIDGIMGAKTRTATINAMNQIGSQLPGNMKYLATGLSVAALIGGSNVDSYIAQFAQPLATAINVSAASYKPSPADAELPALPGIVAPAWYTTTWGKAAIGVGAVAILYMLLGPRPAARAA